MTRVSKLFRSFIYVNILFLAFSTVFAQQKTKGKAVLWEPSNISQKDLFYGPGGREMLPNLSKVTFIKEEKDGYNKKYRIKDGAGRTWVAKLTRETQSETAAVRLMWALGYKTEINYLVSSITIPGKGTFSNVRLEARPDNIERLDEWSWKQNPFIGSKELQGLKIMMVFLTNWDVGDFQNKVLEVKGRNGVEHQYIISDLGATFGRLGNNNLPLFYRFGRQIGKPEHYVKAKLVRDIDEGEVVLAYKGKNRYIFEDITVEGAAWLHNLLRQLSDRQIRDAFRAARYSPQEIDTFTKAVKNRINELARVSNADKFAERK
jgi:hypothetical protein